MASKGKTPRVKWDSEVERKLINIWADIIEELAGKLIRRKKKEAIATTWPNVSISQELNRAEQYTEKEIYNKIDTIMKKEKSMYVNYQQKGETGKEYSQGDAALTWKRQRLPGQTLRHLWAIQRSSSIGPWISGGLSSDTFQYCCCRRGHRVGRRTHTPSSSRYPSR